MDYLVILPTLNEREGLAKTLDELFSVGVPPDKILVVDGGSTDGTCDVARERGVRCIMQEGRGKAAAVKTAFRYADADVLIVMDADFTYPAQHVETSWPRTATRSSAPGGRWGPAPSGFSTGSATGS
jgi:glycosyltransferase involved in cell wall biosynthesis